jgi:hypothetical protein
MELIRVDTDAFSTGYGSGTARGWFAELGLAIETCKGPQSEERGDGDGSLAAMGIRALLCGQAGAESHRTSS